MPNGFTYVCIYKCMNVVYIRMYVISENNKESELLNDLVFLK